jgi:hypothetical protein
MNTIDFVENQMKRPKRMKTDTLAWKQSNELNGLTMLSSSVVHHQYMFDKTFVCLLLTTIILDVHVFHRMNLLNVHRIDCQCLVIFGIVLFILSISTNNHVSH